MKYMHKKYGFSVQFPTGIDESFHESRKYVYDLFQLPLPKVNSQDISRTYGSFGYQDNKKNIVNKLVGSWEPAIHGYTQQDYFSFVDFVYEYTQHLSLLDDLETVYKTFIEVFSNRHNRFLSWRYVAYTLSSQHDASFLAPKDQNSTILYEKIFDRVDDVSFHAKKKRNYRENISAFASKYADQALLQSFLNPFTDYKYYSDLSKIDKKTVPNGYVRLIELNEFLEHGEDDQTLENFLEHNTAYIQQVMFLNLRLLTHTQLLINKVGDRELPLFLHMSRFHENGPTLHKELVKITKAQYIELFTNYQKKPHILRKDNESKTLRYAKGFLENFFSTDEIMHKVPVLSDEKMQDIMFRLLFTSESSQLLNVATTVSKEIGRSRYTFLQLFLNESSLSFDKRARTLLSVMYGDDGESLRQCSTLEIMYLIFAMNKELHFAHTNTGLKLATDILAEFVYNERITTASAIGLIVESMKDPDSIIILDESSETMEILDSLDTTPVSWIMTMLKKKKRNTKRPKFVEETAHLL